MKAIRPQIIKIKRDKVDYWKTELTLNLGRKHQVIKGMIFYYANSNSGISVVVTEPQETTSKAILYGFYGGGKDELKLKKGLIFSSVVPRNYMDLP